MTQCTYRLGIDVGVTFTDLVVARDDGLVTTRKIPSTPADYSKGIADGLVVWLAEAGAGPDSVTGVVHASVRAAARVFIDEGSEAVAVSFLHAYANPVHEIEAAAILTGELGPDIYLCRGSEILPGIREYKRTSTVVVNAAIGPVIARYASALTARLAAVGIGCPVEMMHSGGGIMRLASAVQRAAALHEWATSLEAAARATMRAEGYDLAAAAIRLSGDLRYLGQTYELTVPATGPVAGVAGLFEQEHDRTYGHRSDRDPVELVNLRLAVRLPAATGASRLRPTGPSCVVTGPCEHPVPLRIAVAVTVTDDAIDIDGTCDQVQASINCPISLPESAAFCAIRCLSTEDIPNCEGYLRPITVRAPKGCLLNTRFTLRGDRRDHPPYRLDGGRPGAPSAHVLTGPDGPRVLPAMPMESYCGNENEVFRMQGAGGGGVGDPFLREPERVLKDVLEGKVTRTGARLRAHT